MPEFGSIVFASVGGLLFSEAVDGGGTRAEKVLAALYATAIDRRHRDHYKAAERACAMFAGRPVSALEISGVDGRPVEVNGHDDLSQLTTERLTQRLTDLVALARSRQGRKNENSE